MAKLNNKKLQTQRNFQSIWHSQPEYIGRLLREDQLIREYILGTMKSNGWKLSEIIIKRKVKQIHIAFQIQNKIIKERKRWTKNRLKNRMKYSGRVSRLGRLTSTNINGIGSQKRIKRIKEVSHKKRFLYFQLLLMITELRKMYPNNQISFYIQKVKPLQFNARLIDAWIIANIKKKKSHKRLLNRIIWKYRKGVEKTKPIAKQDGAVLIAGTRNKTIDSTWGLLKKEDKKNFLSWITGNLIYLYNVRKLGLTDLLQSFALQRRREALLPGRTEQFLGEVLNGTNSSSLSTIPAVATTLQNRAGYERISKYHKETRKQNSSSAGVHLPEDVKHSNLPVGRSSRKANSISSFNSFWLKWKIGANRGSMTRSITAGRNRIMAPRSGAKTSPEAAKGLPINITHLRKQKNISQYTLTARQDRAEAPLRGAPGVSRAGYKKRLKGKLPGVMHNVSSSSRGRKDAFGNGPSGPISASPTRGITKRNFHTPAKGNPEQGLMGLRNEKHLPEGFHSLNLRQINSIFPYCSAGPSRASARSKGTPSKVSSTRPIKHSRSLGLPPTEANFHRKEALNIARRNRAVSLRGKNSQELAIRLYYLIRLKYLTFAPRMSPEGTLGLSDQSSSLKTLFHSTGNSKGIIARLAREDGPGGPIIEGLIGYPVVATARQNQIIPCSDNRSAIIHQDLRSTWRLTRKIPRIQRRLGNIRRHLWKQHRNEFNEDTLSLLNYYKLNYVLARIASPSPQSLNVLEGSDKHNTSNLANTAVQGLQRWGRGPITAPSGRRDAKGVTSSGQFLWQGKKFVNFFQLHPPLLDHLIKCLIAIPMFTTKSSEGSLVSFLTHFWIGFFDYIYHYENSLSKWQGIRILLSGRVGFRKMGRAKKYSSFWGVCKNSSARLPLQYSYSQIHTRYGIIGMKIFLR